MAGGASLANMIFGSRLPQSCSVECVTGPNRETRPEANPYTVGSVSRKKGPFRVKLNQIGLRAQYDCLCRKIPFPTHVISAGQADTLIQKKKVGDSTGFASPITQPKRFRTHRSAHHKNAHAHTPVPGKTKTVYWWYRSSADASLAACYHCCLFNNNSKKQERWWLSLDSYCACFHIKPTFPPIFTQPKEVQCSM